MMWRMACSSLLPHVPHSCGFDANSNSFTTPTTYLGHDLMMSMSWLIVGAAMTCKCARLHASNATGHGSTTYTHPAPFVTVSGLSTPVSFNSCANRKKRCFDASTLRQIDSDNLRAKSFRTLSWYDVEHSRVLKHLCASDVFALKILHCLLAQKKQLTVPSMAAEKSSTMPFTCGTSSTTSSFATIAYLKHFGSNAVTVPRKDDHQVRHKIKYVSPMPCVML